MFHRLLCSLLLLSVSSSAALKWEKSWLEFHRAPEDGHIEAVFAFQNTGSAPVTIKSVRTSCGCTSARLEKKLIAPAERGEVKARFVFGDRKGAHRKLITVTTDDGQKQELNLVVVIQEALTIAPALAFWKVGELAEPKVVRLQAAPNTAVRVQSVSSSNPQIIASLITIKEGDQYDLRLKPASTAQKETAEVRVQTDFPRDAPRAYTVHARVK